MPKVAVLDIDGTLVKDLDTSKVLDETCEYLKIELTDELKTKFKFGLLSFLGKCSQIKGFGTTENFANWLMTSNIFEDQNISLYIEFVKTYLLLEMNKIKELSTKLLYSDSLDCLEYLKQLDYRLLIYSNWFRQVQDVKLDVTSITPFIDTIYSIDNNYGKPATKGWNEIITNEQLDPSTTIMIGNSSSDLVPKRIGIPSIIISHGKNLSETIKNKKPFIIDSFTELCDKDVLENVHSRVKK